jgi:mRNA interferase RelE/StbE
LSSLGFNNYYELATKISFSPCYDAWGISSHYFFTLYHRPFHRQLGTLGKGAHRHSTNGVWHGVFHHTFFTKVVWELDKRIMETNYSKSSLKFLATLVKKERLTIIAKIDDYAQNPDTHKNNVKKLRGILGYRLRIGDYRVIFDNKGDVLYIINIGLRGNIYE